MGILMSSIYCLFYGNPVSDAIELIDRGVRLKVLQQVYEEVQAGRLAVPDDFKDPSPGESIVHGLVKPLTNTMKCSYSSYLYENASTRNLVGRINTFVSHPWHYDFGILISALVEYEKTLPKDSDPQYYFVDYFAINQHEPGKDLKRLAWLVGESDTLALMAQPWRQPYVLGRLWCVFEIAHAVMKGTKIEIVLSKDEKQNFQKSLTENDSKSAWELLSDLLKGIKSENATASYEPDIKMIRNLIETDPEIGGYIKVDTNVADGLRNWFLRSAKALLRKPEADKSSNRHAELTWQVAEFHYSQSKYLEAASLYDKAAVIFKKNKHDKWLTCEKDRIFMFRKMKKLKEALAMAKQNLENQTEIRGAKHLGTLESKRCLGAIQKDLGMNREAEENLGAILEVFKETEDPDGFQISATKYQLAEALRNLGRLKQAEEMYEELIQSKTRRSGKDDPSTINCVLMKARCIDLAGNSKDALSAYEDALPKLRMHWGANDPSVIKGSQWIKEAQAKLGKINIRIDF